MPSFDGGHCFLTVLAPIRGDLVQRADGTVTSCIQGLREVLATLPIAQHSPVTVKSTKMSPFARCRAIHLARFVVIDDLPYNGRIPRDAVLAALKHDNPLLPQAVDHLNSDYLLFAADIDAADTAGLDDILRRLWDDAAAELRSVFLHCRGFDDVKTGDGFATYIHSCQIDTTMPFNDYWRVAPGLPRLTLKGLLIGGAAVWLLVSGALYGAELAFAQLGGVWMGLADAVLGLAVALFAVYGVVMRRGAKPFPAAPDSDLPSVLKALYLQQKFIRFAIDAQTDDPATLYSRFAAFLAAHALGNVDSPSQAPGVVQS